MSVHYNKNDEQYIRDHYKELSDAAIGKYLERSETSVKKKRLNMKLFRKRFGRPPGTKNAEIPRATVTLTEEEKMRAHRIATRLARKAGFGSVEECLETVLRWRRKQNEHDKIAH